MKKKKELKKATSSNIYRKILINAVVGCRICGMNSGCNRRYREDTTSWKNYRKTQYRVR